MVRDGVLDLADLDGVLLGPGDLDLVDFLGDLLMVYASQFPLACRSSAAAGYFKVVLAEVLVALGLLVDLLLPLISDS